MSNFFNSRNRILVVLFLISILTLLLSPMVGVYKISLETVFHPYVNGIEQEIFWRIRVPRVCVAFLVGAALAVSGMAFQAMFRNSLATPFTLGVASGASFGATMYLRLGLGFGLSFLGISGVTFFAFLGALLAIFVLYVLTHTRGGFATTTLLLAGVAMNFFFSSFILFTQYMSDFTNSFRIVRWLMGSLEVVGFDAITGLLPFVIIGSGVIFYLAHELNLLMIGEDISTARGVNVGRTKKIIFLITSLMVGGVVAVCGPIGFVGMIAPHICRLIIGCEHRYLTLASFLFGGIFLTICDTFARTLIAPAEMPVGIITSLLGGPFFLWLLFRSPSLRGEIV